MRITEEQERILGSLHCERLSSNVDNFRLVDDFYNGRNPSIVNTLQNEAYEDDANHRVAYYVVKNNSGEILCISVQTKLIVIFGIKQGYIRS